MHSPRRSRLNLHGEREHVPSRFVVFRQADTRTTSVTLTPLAIAAYERFVRAHGGNRSAVIEALADFLNSQLTAKQRQMLGDMTREVAAQRQRGADTT